MKKKVYKKIKEGPCDMSTGEACPRCGTLKVTGQGYEMDETSDNGSGYENFICDKCGTIYTLFFEPTLVEKRVAEVHTKRRK